MMEQKTKKYEIGYLPNEDRNKYWKIKLRKRISWFKNFQEIIGVFIFSLLLIPIIIIALIIAVYCKKKTSKSNHDSTTAQSLNVYQEFMKVYPTRVYSPVSKSIEVGLYSNYDFKAPSLEIAIGDGYFSWLIFKNKNYKLTFGGDMIYETILSAKKYNHINQLVVFDAQEIPFPDNSFKTVIMNNLIHHLPSREKILHEIERVLKPGGKFIFTDNLYGWVSYTFDSRLLRFFHLDYIAKKIEKFKMNLFAQKLIISSQYWDELVKNSQLEIDEKKEFISRQAMTVGSIFEYLNLLQGQPTRQSMKFLLKIKFLKKYIHKLFSRIIEYLIINEQKLLAAAPGAFLFVVLRKKGSLMPSNGYLNKLVCPKCKQDLLPTEGKLNCRKCNISYIIKNSIPILISYQAKLNNFDKYLEQSEKRTIQEYIT